MKILLLLIGTLCLQFYTSAQSSFLKQLTVKGFSEKQFLHAFTIKKETFQNLRLVVDTNPANSFWMAAWEVTNEEYRDFTIYCRDSTVMRLLNYVYPDPITREEVIDWKHPLVWSKKISEGIGPILLRYDSVLNLVIKNGMDIRLGIDAREILYGKWDDSSNIIPVYPDTLCWVKALGDTVSTKTYFASPSFNNHPVVGISYWQAFAYCRWLEKMWNSALVRAGNTTNYFEVRLPNNEEWEAALKLEGTQPADFIFPVAKVLVKNKKTVYYLSGNVLEWLFDSTDTQTNSDKIKTVKGTKLAETIATRSLPASTQQYDIGFRYIVKLKTKEDRGITDLSE